MRLWDLKEKEVINVCDCKRLGCVTDVEIDICKGMIEKIIVPGPGKCCGFLGPEYEYVICWNQIVQIGPDVILVKVDVEKIMVACTKKKHNILGGN